MLQVKSLPGQDAPKQKLKLASGGASTLTSDAAMPPLPESSGPSTSLVDEAATVISDAHRMRQKVGAPLWFLSWVAFLIVGALLVGIQYYVSEHYEWRSMYGTGRIIVFLFFQLVVLLVAFDEGLFQGVLCLLLPFYIIYYAFTRMEYVVLRGVFAAVYFALGTELYFFKDFALASVMQVHVNEFIRWVEQLIQRASAPPV